VDKSQAILDAIKGLVASNQAANTTPSSVAPAGTVTPIDADTTTTDATTTPTPTPTPTPTATEETAAADAAANNEAADAAASQQKIRAERLAAYRAAQAKKAASLWNK
jgi:hypothetical protein